MSPSLEAVTQRRVTVATWIGFAAMCVGMFMAILDVQVVVTSLPTIQSALEISPDRMSWIQTAYLIAEVIAIPMTGFLTRMLSMRWLFVVALIVFTLASIECAASQSFPALITWRIVQGFAGGTLIPAVFSAVFLLFPPGRQAIATTLAGVLAVLAPTVGPIVGGWITQTYSWHWLFLINVVPGVVAIGLAVVLLPRDATNLAEAYRLDALSLAMMAVALAALEIALKEGPQRGWTSGLIVGLVALSVASGIGFVRRTLNADVPIVDLKNFADRNFMIGSVLSFVLGIGLFGSVYLMPVFLAFVRDHNALQIGQIMLVTGIAQIAIAPVAVALERRCDVRMLTAVGFALFAIGLGLSSLQTPQSDYDAMFWPQVVRGLAIMFCLLPPTRLALGGLAPDRVPDASGLFNLMRNLGGAIGLALIDTVMFSRAPVHGAAIVERLQAGDLETARFIGLPSELMAARAPGPIDAEAAELLRPLIEKAALVQSINEAWALIAILTLAALAFVPFARKAEALDPAGR
ncbi:MAG: DHA2 family efflux MFS transporter permease subunit [Burkholderiales bacterium]|jgi:DHA2 family multidrug resistance protein|nr:DHA2 family efflux MFS transporter permease subunit [Burkholderiales bacterium]